MAKILIVDDSKSFRQMLTSILESAGHTVAEAKDGKQALELCSQEEFQLVVTDIYMPYVDGLDVVEKLHADERYAEVPLLIITKEGDEVMKEKGKRAGAAGWITKPIIEENFLAAIERALKFSLTKTAVG